MNPSPWILALTVPLFLALCAFSSVNGNCSSAHRTCGNCSLDSNCFWCLDPPGCMDLDQSCREVYENENAVNIQDYGNNVQIYPEHVKLMLIPGREEEITFNMTQFSEYPLDLYFLVDLSWSMSTARDNIAIQGEKIVKEISRLTKNLKVGFGSFIEKDVPPFTSAIREFNCPMNPGDCPSPYSFYHQMPIQKLSPDTFRRYIESAPLGGNVDSPESGFDGIMQAMACNKEIGWRNNSRKIILMATDGDFHFALDGKLIGLLEPNDGECHLDGNGHFTQEKIMDYPSISQIDASASYGSYTLIFAVTSAHYQMYRHLSKQISGSHLAILEKDASNIADIIRVIYERITTTAAVTIKKDSPGDESYSVQIYANCNGPFIVAEKCKDIQIGTPVEFKAVVQVNECFEGTKSIFVRVVGIPKSMRVDLESKCGCDCESSGNNISSSKACNDNGALQCGVCYCDEGFMGASCDCMSEYTLEEQNDECVSPEDEEALCSNKGECICGQCNCRDPYYGPFCQCDDSSCLMDANGLICSGNGKCICNECTCDPKWTGVNCGCSKNTLNCKSPYNGLECSGEGTCECNSKCICKGGSSGKYCQFLPQTSDSCSLIRACVEGRVFGGGEELMKREEPAGCSALQVVFLDNFLEENKDGEEVCVFTREEDGCRYEFRVSLNSNRKVKVYALGDKDLRCSYYSVDYLAISLSTIGITLLLGLLGILVYKLYLIYRDKREYEQFLIWKENQKYILNHNALYKHPVSKFKNPTYLPSRPSGK